MIRVLSVIAVQIFITASENLYKAFAVMCSASTLFASMVKNRSFSMFKKGLEWVFTLLSLLMGLLSLGITGDGSRQIKKI